MILLLLGLGIGYAAKPNPSSKSPQGESLPVNATVTNQNIQFSAEPMEISSQGENYFVNYRLQREQSRQEAKNMLAPLLNSNVATTQEEAQKKWLELTQKIKTEGEIENLLKIKGFRDAVVDMSPKGVNVVIYTSELSGNEVRLIQEIVIQIANVRVDKIAISFKP